MREQVRSARPMKGSQVIPESDIVAEWRVGLPLRMAIVYQLGNYASLRLGACGDMYT